MTRSTTRRGILACAIAVAIGGAFVAGRAASKSAERTSVAVPAAERPAFERGDPSAPPWSPTGAWVLPEVGSIFRGRLARAESPLDGIEAVLVTPRTEECLDDCPLGLRVIGGENGARMLAKILPSLDPDLRRLIGVDVMPDTVGSRLRRAEAELAQDASLGRADEGRPPTRAMFVGMPRPDVAPGAWSVGFVMTDLPDPHFDPPRPGDARRESRCLFVTRVEVLDERGKPRVLLGAVAVGRTVGRLSRPIPADATALSATFGSLWGHFGAIPEEIGGLHLDRDGRIHGFGSDLRLRPLAESPLLRGALLALLRRA